MTDVRTDDTQRRYAEERDKRKAALAETGAGFRRLEELIDPDAQDPYREVEPREPLTDHVETTIVGAGWAGLLSAAELTKAGRDYRLLDAAGGPGGVWYWNRYPGLMCDTASMVYLPLLEETGYLPTEKYAHGPEIRGHAERIAATFDVDSHAYYHTRVTRLTWLEDDDAWLVETNRGDRFTSTVVVVGIGPLSTPIIPTFEGVEDFKGDWFHTARWDYSITGGSPEGEPMEKLRDKRVAMIGTGATALQAVPELAKTAGELFVIQRTPTAVAERNNGPVDYDWLDELTAKEGWQDLLYENFIDHAEEWRHGRFPKKDSPDLLADGWTQMARRVERSVEELGEGGTYRDAVLANDDDIQGGIRDRVDELVDDPADAEHLKAWYRRWCKRPGFHDEYLQSFNRDNVHLVDTDGKGVERITENGVVVGGREYEVDLIVYGTGFTFGRNLAENANFEIVGRGGRTLNEKFVDGPYTYMGWFTRGFPNLFLHQNVQAALLASNVSQNYVHSARALRAVLDGLDQRDAKTFEPDKKAEDEWVSYLENNGTPFGDQECTPGYYNGGGKEPGLEERRAVGYPKGQRAFFERAERWRTRGDFEGLAFA